MRENHDFGDVHDEAIWELICKNGNFWADAIFEFCAKPVRILCAEDNLWEEGAFIESVSQKDMKEKITDKTAIVSLTQISNSLGTVNPAREIVKIAKEKNVLTIIDAAQSIPRMKIDVKNAENIWKKAIKLLNGPCPRKHEHGECEWCAWEEMEE